MRLLATARHPGPAHALAALLCAVPEADWTILASPDAEPVLRRRASGLNGRVRILRIPDSEPRDVRRWVKTAVEAVDPELVVRTTPSTGYGADEALSSVIADRLPVLVLQDFPGVGQALGDDTDPAGERSRMIATPDVFGAAQLARRGLAARVTGWIAHERFLHAPPWESARAQGRRRLGVADGDLVVLVVGSSADLQPAVDEQLLEDCAPATNGELGTAHLLYKAHPRRDAAGTARIAAASARLGARPLLMERPLLSESMILAMPDLVVSRASVMNLEALAYADVSGQPAPLSAYSGDFDTSTFPGYWGSALPPTHRPGHGSLITRPGELWPVVAPLLHRRSAGGQHTGGGAAYAPPTSLKEDLRQLVRALGLDL